jgi:DNA-binding CsgD family transcriptional regulator
MTRFPDLCPHCGQALPTSAARLTPRELDVLVGWYTTRTVKKAAVLAGITEQRAKNLLAAARNRSRVSTTAQLLAMHFTTVTSAVAERMTHKENGAEAA